MIGNLIVRSQPSGSHLRIGLCAAWNPIPFIFLISVSCVSLFGTNDPSKKTGCDPAIFAALLESDKTPHRANVRQHPLYYQSLDGEVKSFDTTQIDTKVPGEYYQGTFGGSVIITLKDGRKIATANSGYFAPSFAGLKGIEDVIAKWEKTDVKIPKYLGAMKGVDGRFILVQEYIPGPTLLEKLPNPRDFSKEKAVRIYNQLKAAVRIHPDPHLNNFILDEAIGTVTLIDIYDPPATKPQELRPEVTRLLKEFELYIAQ
jgi:hypothetical protein